MLLKVKWTNDTAPIPQCSSKSAVEQGKVARYEFVGGNATENGEADTAFGKLYKQATGKILKPRLQCQSTTTFISNQFQFFTRRPRRRNCRRISRFKVERRVCLPKLQR